MLRPLEEEGAGTRPGTGIPTSPLMEHLSNFSISTELGQSDWRISPYETNPPSDEDETGEGLSCTRTLQHPQHINMLHTASKQTDQQKGLLASQAFNCNLVLIQLIWHLQTLNIKDAHNMQAAICMPSCASTDFPSALQ